MEERKGRTDKQQNDYIRYFILTKGYAGGPNPFTPQDCDEFTNEGLSFC